MTIEPHLHRRAAVSDVVRQHQWRAPLWVEVSQAHHEMVAPSYDVGFAHSGPSPDPDFDLRCAEELIAGLCRPCRA